MDYVKPVSGNEAIKRVLIDRINEWVIRIKGCKDSIAEVLEQE